MTEGFQFYFLGIVTGAAIMALVWGAYSVIWPKVPAPRRDEHGHFLAHDAGLHVTPQDKR